LLCFALLASPFLNSCKRADRDDDGDAEELRELFAKAGFIEDENKFDIRELKNRKRKVPPLPGFSSYALGRPRSSASPMHPFLRASTPRVNLTSCNNVGAGGGGRGRS
jgi:hypothetical protein